MYKSLKVLIAMALLLSSLLVLPAAAQRIDLSSWSASTIILDHPNQGEWLLFDDNRNVVQAEQCSPSFFHNNIVESNFIMSGTVFVGEYSDDDLIGFAFGYQDPSHCYILDWKKTAQGSGESFRDEGFVIRMMHGDLADMTYEDYWAHVDGAEHYTVLDSHLGTGLGWRPFILYDFTLEFSSGSFVVILREEDTVLWTAVIDDGDYTSGEFAFYCYSQSSAVFTGFNQEPIPTEQHTWSEVKALYR